MDSELIYTALLEIKGSLGEVKAAIIANSSHTIAVSLKADAIRTELATHAKRDEDHYLDQEAHGRGSMLKWLVAVAAVVLGAEGLIHIVMPFLKG